MSSPHTGCHQGEHHQHSDMSYYQITSVSSEKQIFILNQYVQLLLLGWCLYWCMTHDTIWAKIECIIILVVWDHVSNRRIELNHILMAPPPSLTYRHRVTNILTWHLCHMSLVCLIHVTLSHICDTQRSLDMISHITISDSLWPPKFYIIRLYHILICQHSHDTSTSIKYGALDHCQPFYMR